MVLICYILKDHVTKVSSRFMVRGPSREITILTNLVEIWRDKCVLGVET